MLQRPDFVIQFRNLLGDVNSAVLNVALLRRVSRVVYGIMVESIQCCTFWEFAINYVAFCRTTNAELSRISAPAKCC